VQESDPGERLVKRWSHNLTGDFKKIAWTTEKGDVSALRNQLMVHTNSLDLVMGVIVKSPLRQPSYPRRKRTMNKTETAPRPLGSRTL
jgi:hypothetical protein